VVSARHRFEFDEDALAAWEVVGGALPATCPAFHGLVEHHSLLDG